MTNKKKIIAGLTIGGLVLSAPFAAFAFGGVNNDEEGNQRFQGAGFEGSLLDEPNYAIQVEMLDKAIERKIEQANLLIEKLGTDDSNVDELEKIVAEFVELDTFLDQIDIDEKEADYLKEIFLEYKGEATDLTTEFRTIITTNLTDDEITTLRNELRSQKNFQEGMGPKFDAKTLEMIDSDLATAYANGELTEEEVMEAVKEIMDAMTDEERDALHSEMVEAGFSPRGDGSHSMNGSGRENSGRGEGMHQRMQ